MKIRMQMPSKQKGFSILSGFILAIIMFGALTFFLAGQGLNSTFGTTYANTAKVSGLLTSAGYVKMGFDAVVLSGQLPVDVTFNTTTTTGIFNPSSGAVPHQYLDPTLFDPLSWQVHFPDIGYMGATR